MTNHGRIFRKRVSNQSINHGSGYIRNAASPNAVETCSKVYFETSNVVHKA